MGGWVAGLFVGGMDHGGLGLWVGGWLMIGWLVGWLVDVVLLGCLYDWFDGCLDAWLVGLFRN